MTFEMKIPDSDIAILHSVLGKPITKLFSSTLGIQAGENVFIYGHDFSFTTSNAEGFFTVRTGEWFDTPIFAINCFELRVEIHAQPYGFEAQFNNPSSGWHPPFNEVMLGHHLIPVTRIDVYTIERLMADEITQEIARFDHAIRFERENGSQFCLVVADESIAGDLILYWDLNIINQILSKSDIRHTIR